jgi:hypothetical protein
MRTSRMTTALAVGVFRAAGRGFGPGDMTGQDVGDAWRVVAADGIDRATAPAADWGY